MPMRNRLHWLIWFGILVALGAVLSRNDELWNKLSEHELASLTTNGVWAAVVAAGVVVLFRNQLSKALLAALLWTVVGLALLVGYTYRSDLRAVGDRVMAEVMPGWPAQRGNTVEIARGRSGDFAVRAQVNGARVSMVLDSGASAVVLTQEAAKAAGLPLEVLQYSTNVETANGRTRVAPVTLDRLTVGDIVERSVPALIAQPGQLKSSLLGMSFLNRLESWEVRGDKLMLRAYP
jgi:aspartyl protease family protein